MVENNPELRGLTRKHINQLRHIASRVKSLKSHDNIRYFKILEILQYTVLYCIFGFIFAIISNKLSSFLFKPFNPHDAKCEISAIIKLLAEIIVQLCFISLSIFYIIKIVKIIPLFFTTDNNYIPYKTKEYAGGIALSFMFLKMQPYLSEKLSFIMKCMMKLTGTVK